MKSSMLFASLVSGFNVVAHTHITTQIHMVLGGEKKHFPNVYFLLNGKFLHISQYKHCLPSVMEEGFILCWVWHSPLCKSKALMWAVPSKWIYTVCMRACASAYPCSWTNYLTVCNNGHWWQPLTCQAHEAGNATDASRPWKTDLKDVSSQTVQLQSECL